VKTMSTAPPSGRPLLPAMNERSSDHGAIPSPLHGEALGLASLLANGTRDGVAIVGPDGKLIFWNAAAGAITGWSSQAIAERNIAKLLQVPQALIEIRDGKWVEIRQSALEADGKPFVVVIFTDATSHVRLKDTRDQLRALGLIDSATNLPGREVAMLHIEQAIAMAKRDKRSVGLLSLKLDRFRQLREGADGHAAADEVVRQFAKRITAFVRASDVPARLADDSPNRSTSLVMRGPCTAVSASRRHLETQPMRSHCSARRSRPPIVRRSSVAVVIASLRTLLLPPPQSPRRQPRPKAVLHQTSPANERGSLDRSTADHAVRSGCLTSSRLHRHHRRHRIHRRHRR
jgi:hypothetical protein